MKVQSAGCARWLQFLNSIFDEACLQEVLRRWFAYHLVPDMGPVDQFLFLVGPAASGKTTIANVLMRMVGVERFQKANNAQLASSFGLSYLVGKRGFIIEDFAHMPDLADGLVSIRLKSIVAGETVVVEEPAGIARLEVLPCRVTAIGNSTPEWLLSRRGLLRRCVVLKTAQSFRGREDVTLKSDLFDELEGIREWAAAAIPDVIELGRIVRR